MRATARADGFSVHAISGTNAVLLAMNALPEARKDLLGFAIGRRSGDGERIRWLDGFKFFRALVADPHPGETRSTLEHPIQSFLWGHYTAEPDTDYDYTIRPLFRPETGDLAKLRAGTDVRRAGAHRGGRSGHPRDLLQPRRHPQPGVRPALRQPAAGRRERPRRRGRAVAVARAARRRRWTSSPRRAVRASRCAPPSTSSATGR